MISFDIYAHVEVKKVKFYVWVKFKYVEFVRIYFLCYAHPRETLCSEGGTRQANCKNVPRICSYAAVCCNFWDS